MKPVDDNRHLDDDRRFDLLVDGELSEAERRELLAGLDHEPDGWRRCALAFLEAQCWKEGFGALVRRPEAQPAPSRAAQQSARRFWLFNRHGTALAMAASFLVALFLSSYVQRVWHQGGWGAGPPLETVASIGGSAVVGPSAVPSPDVALAAAGRSAAQPGRWETVTLSMPGGSQGGRQAIELPVVERESIDDAWLQSLPAVVPADVLKALERTGHRIRQQRELLPLEMNDGRRLVVPVDQVEVHYVGNPTY
jgi:hypothetical protein